MHVSPVVEHIRWYSKGTFENRDPYDFIVTITWLNDKEIYAQGALGNLSKDRVSDMIKYYKDKGVKKIRFERNGFEVVK